MRAQAGKTLLFRGIMYGSYLQRDRPAQTAGGNPGSEVLFPLTLSSRLF